MYKMKWEQYGGTGMEYEGAREVTIWMKILGTEDKREPVSFLTISHNIG